MQGVDPRRASIVRRLRSTKRSKAGKFSAQSGVRAVKCQVNSRI